MSPALSDFASVVVGAGGGASAAYAVRRVSIDTERVARERGGAAPSRIRSVAWTLECVAEAADYASVAALRDTLEAELARHGEQVQLTRGGATHTMPAGDGSSGASMAGYPRVKITDVPESSFGPYRTFTLTAETMIPEPIGGGGADASVVHHDHETTTSTDQYGQATTRVSGSLVMSPDADAEDWIEANVFTPARTAADAAGSPFITRITVGLDAAHATYEHETQPPAAISGGGVEAAQVRAVTREDSRGRIAYVVTGSARGGSATMFAQAQEPSVSSSQVLTKREISEPEVESGRVSFSYERLDGVVDDAVGDRPVLLYSESFTPAPTNRLTVAAFGAAAPISFLDPDAGYIYTQRTTIEHLGDPLDDAEIAALLAYSTDAMLTDEPIVTPRAAEPGVHSIEITASFWFATAQARPTPHAVPGLGGA